MTTATTIDPAHRLLWHLEVDGRRYQLDLLPAFGRGPVSAGLDGRRVGTVAKPTAQHPWTETTLSIGRHDLTIGLSHGPVMATNVFIDGRSCSSALRRR